MKVLLSIFLLLSACTDNRSQGIKPANFDMPLPTCRFIYIDECKYLWCRTYYSGGLESIDSSCRPTNANVSDLPISKQQLIELQQ